MIEDSARTSQSRERRGLLAGKASQYAIAASGPFATAAAQFFLSLILLRVTTADHFGAFSFLLVSAQLSWGIWSALFCAPLPVLLARYEGYEFHASISSLFTANLIGAGIAFLLFVVIGLSLGIGYPSAAFFGAFAALALLRWFARAYSYATGKPVRTWMSDIVYSLIVSLGAVVIWSNGDGTLTLTWGVSALAVGIGLLPFGREYLMRQFAHFKYLSLTGYRAVWREHSGWSLLGVFSTEATANSHVYIVTTIAGPAAFAPLAASALLIRPVTVAMNALTEFERARMGRQLGMRDFEGAKLSARFFRWALIATWIATAILTSWVLAYAPHLVFPTQYGNRFLAVGAALWMAVAWIRLLRMPESCLLQAGGAFRLLAFASIWSSGVSIAAVLILLILVGPLWSIIGILMGEAMFAVAIWHQAKRWLIGERGLEIVKAENAVPNVALQCSPVPKAL